MNILWQVLYLLIWLFYVLLIGRIIVEFVRFFARSWMPAGRPAIVVEVVYTMTDPPVKLLRRIIPTVRLGGVALDLSVFVLLIAISWILLPFLEPLVIRSA